MVAPIGTDPVPEPAVEEHLPENQFGFWDGPETYGVPLEAVMTMLALIVPMIFAVAWFLSRVPKTDRTIEDIDD